MAADEPKAVEDHAPRPTTDAATEAMLAQAERVLSGTAGSEEIETLRSAALALEPRATGPTFALLARRLNERSVPLLREIALSSQPGHAREALVALGHVRHADAAAALQAIAEADVAKDVRKEARRSLFRLRAAGIEPAAAAQPPAPGVAHQVLAAKVSNVDGWGNRIVALSTAAPLGAAELVAVVISDERGIVEVHGTRLPRPDLERQIETLSQGTPTLHLVDAPVDYCRQAVIEAHQLNRATGQPVPPEYYVWRHVVGQPELVPEREPVYDEVDPAVVRWNPQILEESGELMHTPEFQSWIIPPEIATEAMQDAVRSRASQLVLPGQTQMDANARAVDRLLVAFFNEQRRRDYSRRLEQSAYVLKKIGRDADARRALAAALALQPSSSTPLMRQPLPMEMARHTLTYLEARSRPGQERPGGLVLPP